MWVMDNETTGVRGGNILEMDVFFGVVVEDDPGGNICESEEVDEEDGGGYACAEDEEGLEGWRKGIVSRSVLRESGGGDSGSTRGSV